MIIGLTGGIGSGKSAVANFFQDEGITVIDADELAREVIDKNSPGYKSIVDYFGSKIIDSNGLIDRAFLRKEAFDDDKKKKSSRIYHSPISQGFDDKKDSNLKLRLFNYHGALNF